MKKYFVILFCLIAFSVVKAQNNPLINPQINEISTVKLDSIRLFTYRYTGFFKSKIIPAQDLFSSKQLFFNSGPYFTHNFSHDTVQKPIRINYYYGNLKPILKTDAEAFSLYKKARIFKYTSDAFFVAEFTFAIVLINRWTSDVPSTFEQNRKSRMLFNASLGSCVLSIASQYVSRHYLNKSIKKYNQKVFAY